MKILVITFSRGLNPGTFMQAYGVRTGLFKIFPDAEINYLSFLILNGIKGNVERKIYWTCPASKGVCGLSSVEIQEIREKGVCLYTNDRFV